jgi:archaellum component FlaC
MSSGELKAKVEAVQTALQEIAVLRQQINVLMSEVSQRFQFSLATINEVVGELPPQS